MTEEVVSSIPSASDSAGAVLPAPAADDQKPGDAAPASGADVQNSETAETPEQIAAKQESRRARSNARKAQVLAEARAEAKLLREERDRLLSERKPASPASDEPKREQFDDLEAYYRAVARWEAKTASESTLKSAREAQQGREAQDRQERTRAEVAKNWGERESEFTKATKDYEKVVGPFVEDELQDLHQAARSAIVESENGPALLYHLANHPEEAERIATLSPTRQIAELGKMETQLGKVVKPSNAPAPATPIGQGKSGTKDPSKMTDAEYRSFRKSQGARWAQ